MSERFPLIKRLGLEVRPADQQFMGEPTVRASEFERVLREAPVSEIYAWPYGDKTYWRMPNLGEPDSTHTARLFDVREIEKRSCEHHEILKDVSTADATVITCMRCGAKLTATWRVEGEG